MIYYYCYLDFYIFIIVMKYKRYDCLEILKLWLYYIVGVIFFWFIIIVEGGYRVVFFDRFRGV